MSRVIARTVDYHTAGEPFRIVTDGVPELGGTTVLAKRRYAADHLDATRQLLVNEPRGHADMYGCFVTTPNDDGADLGAVFFHNAGYSTACGHGTIALVTWALESGRVTAVEPETRVVVDVPSGRLGTVATVVGGRVRSVRFTNVPAFVEVTGCRLDALADGGGSVDVAYGGAFYASVDSGAAGISVSPENVGRFIQLGRQIKRELEQQRQFCHPLEPELRDIYGVIFFQDEDASPAAGGGDGGGGDADRHALVQRNVTVFADGEVDRSPCGSGTSARLALLAREGRLRGGESLLHRSIIGTEFTASIVEETEVASRAAVVTEVEGAAFRTGSHVFELDPDDPLNTGFRLR